MVYVGGSSDWCFFHLGGYSHIWGSPQAEAYPTTKTNRTESVRLFVNTHSLRNSQYLSAHSTRDQHSRK
jgi:hypothetical protein